MEWKGHPPCFDSWAGEHNLWQLNWNVFNRRERHRERIWAEREMVRGKIRQRGPAQQKGRRAQRRKRDRGIGPKWLLCGGWDFNRWRWGRLKWRKLVTHHKLWREVEFKITHKKRDGLTSNACKWKGWEYLNNRAWLNMVSCQVWHIGLICCSLEVTLELRGHRVELNSEWDSQNHVSLRSRVRGHFGDSWYIGQNKDHMWTETHLKQK